MKGRKIIKKVALIVGLIVLAIFAINWLMTFRLEDTLRNRLRAEVIKATDGFYDCSFDKIHVDFFTGELMLQGLSLFPDTASLRQCRQDSLLPSLYLDVNIETIDFKGINLTWLFNYRKLSFEEFLIRSPSIKIYSPSMEYRVKSDSLNRVKSFHESMSSFFDVIQAKYISLRNADVRYEVEDLVTAYYSLQGFDFTAYNFVLDEKSQERGNLLFSDNFSFKAMKPQVIFDSERFLFDIEGIELSTIDSLVHVRGTHFRTKDEYWKKKQTVSGSYNNIEVGDFKLEGICFKRKGSHSYLETNRLSIAEPKIEYLALSKAVDKEAREPINANNDTESLPWSLYAVTKPILESISIGEIDIQKGYFKYVRTEDEEEDQYILNQLDFRAYGFIVDSLHQDYQVINYVEEFEINASEIEGHIPSKNILASIDNFHLSTLDKSFVTQKIIFSPISLTDDKEHVDGEIEELEIRNIKYDKGFDADLLSIQSPKINYISASVDRITQKNSRIERENKSKILEAVVPLVRYVAVRDIAIKRANATFTDRKANQIYTLRNLDFYVKNFFVDERVKHIKDYLFNWDEYKIRFEDFDNLTPDKKYRVKIKEGNFNSVSGDVFVKSLEIIPLDTIVGSYVGLSTPYATLSGFNQEDIKNKRLSFRKINLENPIVEVVKRKEEGVATKNKKDPIGLDQISFDSLFVTNVSTYFYDEEKKESIQMQTPKLTMDSLFWDRLKSRLSLGDLTLTSPNISIVGGINRKEKEARPVKEKSLLNEIVVKHVDITQPDLKLRSPDIDVDLTVDNYSMKSFYWNKSQDSLLSIASLSVINPSVVLSRVEEEKNKQKQGNLRFGFRKLMLGHLEMPGLNLRYNEKKKEGEISFVNGLQNTSLLIDNLEADIVHKTFDTEELAFKTQNISYPLSSGFYTLKIKDIEFSKKQGILEFNNIRLDPACEKFDFSYIHPRGADWFDVEIGQVGFSGIDFDSYKKDSILRAKTFSINDVLLQNLKNQKVEVGSNLVPLFYEQFQRFPIKYHIDSVDIKNFTVLYEELPKKGATTLHIPFVGMNGRTTNFTNIQSGKGDFYTLEVEGLAMGTAPLSARWKMPVDTINDKFYFTASIKDLNLKDLNQIVKPSAPAYLKNGFAKELYLHAEASSLGAVVDLKFEYDSLDLVILKRLGGESENKLMTKIVNRVGINESNTGKNMRIVHDTIIRDPYHSNFNYFWQMLRPTMPQAVGVTEEKQNIMHNLNVIARRLKNFFKGDKKDKK